ncbi:hypothetical protein BC567DRAFT_60786 [Phyllosticta citribraziliensis]
MFALMGNFITISIFIQVAVLTCLCDLDSEYSPERFGDAEWTGHLRRVHLQLFGVYQKGLWPECIASAFAATLVRMAATPQGTELIDETPSNAAACMAVRRADWVAGCGADSSAWAEPA